MRCMVVKLTRLLFPVGEIENQKFANCRTTRFGNCQEKDSTGICFIGERRFTDFLKQYLPAQAGKLFWSQAKKLVNIMA